MTQNIDILRELSDEKILREMWEDAESNQRELVATYEDETTEVPTELLDEIF